MLGCWLLLPQPPSSFRASQCGPGASRSGVQKYCFPTFISLLPFGALRTKPQLLTRTCIV